MSNVRRHTSPAWVGQRNKLATSSLSVMLDSQRVAWMFGDESPSPGALLRFSATAYCKGSKTASGVPPRTGVAAADPALLPVGSVGNIATATRIA